MNVALYDADKTNFPNLALMKISAYHKSQGNTVEWYNRLMCSGYDTIYSSKVFTFTEGEPISFNKQNQLLVQGGTGHEYKKAHFSTLPDDVEHVCPDYGLYHESIIDGCSYGFTTRGCPNKCPWCIVPNKEGSIREHADIDEFLRHNKLILMDNNILASEHGIRQIEKIAKKKVKLDINQGVDARLIDDSVARLFAKIKWIRYVRLACDSEGQRHHVIEAVKRLRWFNVLPAQYFCYVLVKDVEVALETIKLLKALYIKPYAQPYRDFVNNTEPTEEQKLVAEWVQNKAAFNLLPFEDFKKNHKLNIHIKKGQRTLFED